MQLDQTTQNAIGNLSDPNVQALAQRLGEYGLAVGVPHIHDDNGMSALPDGIVQVEENCHVRFVPEGSHRSAAVPVQIMADEHGNVRTTGWCCDW